jgi:hypothetical protein
MPDLTMAIAMSTALSPEPGGIHVENRKYAMHRADGIEFSSTLVTMYQKRRLVHDCAEILVTLGLFTRFSRLKFAFIEASPIHATFSV